MSIREMAITVPPELAKTLRTQTPLDNPQISLDRARDIFHKLNEDTFPQFTITGGSLSGPSNGEKYPGEEIFQEEGFAAQIIRATRIVHHFLENHGDELGPEHGALHQFGDTLTHISRDIIDQRTRFLDALVRGDKYRSLQGANDALAQQAEDNQAARNQSIRAARVSEYASTVPIIDPLFQSAETTETSGGKPFDPQDIENRLSALATISRLHTCIPQDQEFPEGSLEHETLTISRKAEQILQNIMAAFARREMDYPERTKDNDANRLYIAATNGQHHGDPSTLLNILRETRAKREQENTPLHASLTRLADAIQYEHYETLRTDFAALQIHADQVIKFTLTQIQTGALALRDYQEAAERAQQACRDQYKRLEQKNMDVLKNIFMRYDYIFAVLTHIQSSQ